MPYHALEIILARPATPAELHQAAHTLPLAANRDATRVLALVRAKAPGRAAHRLRRRLGAQLPIDVITTHYPDVGGQILLNVAFPPDVHATLRRTADQAGQPPEHFVALALHRALAQHADEETDRLDRAVHGLLAGTTAAHLLAAVGRAMTHPIGDPSC
ncbi:hypothetical protein [Streptomyces mutabilis]|uniref:hypothetical protein n=1 Tax=Streptomyces mutabilis TaxID=67332 RepID=UPI0036833677